MVSLVDNSNSFFKLTGNVKDIQQANMVLVLGDLVNDRSMILDKVDEIAQMRKSNEKPIYLIENPDSLLVKFKEKKIYLVSLDQLKQLYKKTDDSNELCDHLSELCATNKYNEQNIKEAFDKFWTSLNFRKSLKVTFLKKCLELMNAPKKEREKELDDILESMKFHTMHNTIVKTDKEALVTFLKEKIDRSKFYIFIGDYGLLFRFPNEADFITRMLENSRIYEALKPIPHMLYMNIPEETQESIDRKENGRSRTAGSTY